MIYFAVTSLKHVAQLFSGHIHIKNQLGKDQNKRHVSLTVASSFVHMEISGGIVHRIIYTSDRLRFH